MGKLNDLQLASLLEEVACAMSCGTPVIDSVRRLQSQRLGSVARAAGEMAAGLDRGESLVSLLDHANSVSAEQASAAVAISQRNGNVDAINRLVRLLRRRADYRETSRLLWFYPVLLLGLGYAVAVLVMVPLIRNTSASDFTWSPAVLWLASWLATNWWIPPVVGVVFCLAICIWLFNRDKFPKQARLSLFCDTLADQIDQDVPEAVAIESAAKMSGDSKLMGLKGATLNSSEINELLALHPAGLAWDSVLLSEKQTWIAKLRYLASMHAEKARRHRYMWTRLLPRVAMVVIGFSLTLSCVVWVIAPVYSEVARW